MKKKWVSRHLHIGTAVREALRVSLVLREEEAVDEAIPVEVAELSECARRVVLAREEARRLSEDEATVIPERERRVAGVDHEVEITVSIDVERLGEGGGGIVSEVRGEGWHVEDSVAVVDEQPAEGLPRPRKGREVRSRSGVRYVVQQMGGFSTQQCLPCRPAH